MCSLDSSINLYVLQDKIRPNLTIWHHFTVILSKCSFFQLLAEIGPKLDLSFNIIQFQTILPLFKNLLGHIVDGYYQNNIYFNINCILYEEILDYSL